MADYIYLLENRLSGPQRSALRTVREISKTKGLTVFLVGGAVRDLTSGSPVRDLDVVVQGSALKLRKDLEKAGAIVNGEHEPGQALFLRFPGGVRMEVGSTLSVTFPKPGKAVSKPSTILEDLRRRDFTANAMALSLNEGSYGLLMDPLNGVADIENRELRLVSNYGFLEDPARMIRAARLMARLGWTLDERTQRRYETGVEEGYISALSEFRRGYETEEIVHEEDPLRVLQRLEADGWMKHLAPFWTSEKVNTAELERLRDVQTQLQMQGIHPDAASANFALLTAKLTPKDLLTLKNSFPRQGFAAEIEGLEAEAKEFGTRLAGKGAGAPSEAWKMITAASPEGVLWTAYANKSGVVQAKLKSFQTEWPLARTKIPYATMLEMRITPELPGYEDLLEKLFFELMDGRLQTPEEMKAFLEPFSPPAPPPPPSTRRPRAAKKEAKGAKSRAKKAVSEDELEVELEVVAAVARLAPADEGAPEAEEEGGVASELAMEEVEGADQEVEEAEIVRLPASSSAPRPGDAAQKPASHKAGSTPLKGDAPHGSSVAKTAVKEASKADSKGRAAGKSAAAAGKSGAPVTSVAAAKSGAPMKSARPMKSGGNETAPGIKEVAGKAPAGKAAVKAKAPERPAPGKKTDSKAQGAHGADSVKTAAKGSAASKAASKPVPGKSPGKSDTGKPQQEAVGKAAAKAPPPAKKAAAPPAGKSKKAAPARGKK